MKQYRPIDPPGYQTPPPKLKREVSAACGTPDDTDMPFELQTTPNPLSQFFQNPNDQCVSQQIRHAITQEINNNDVATGYPLFNDPPYDAFTVKNTPKIRRRGQRMSTTPVPLNAVRRSTKPTITTSRTPIPGSSGERSTKGGEGEVEPQCHF